MKKKKFEPKPEDCTEIRELKESAEALEESGSKVIHLRDRFRRIGRKLGMEVTDTGQWPVVKP